MHTSEEIVRRLRHVPLSNGFRASYDYDNLLYIVAGLVIEACSGGFSWQEFIKTRIFDQLHMTQSLTALPPSVKEFALSTHLANAKFQRENDISTSDSPSKEVYDDKSQTSQHVNAKVYNSVFPPMECQKINIAFPHVPSDVVQIESSSPSSSSSLSSLSSSSSSSSSITTTITPTTARHSLPRVQLIPHSPMESAASCGGLISNITDMLKWMRMLLQTGMYHPPPVSSSSSLISKDKSQNDIFSATEECVQQQQSKPLFSEKQHAEIFRPQTLLNVFPTRPGSVQMDLTALNPLFFHACTPGWFTRDYCGKAIAYHTGGHNGMVCKISLVHDLKLGVLVLTNQQDWCAYESMTMQILDYFMYKLPCPRNMVDIFIDRKKLRVSDAISKVEHAFKLRNPATKPSLSLKHFAGKYTDKWYGEVTIVHVPNSNHFHSFSNLSAQLINSKSFPISNTNLSNTTKSAIREQLQICFAHSPSLTGILVHFQFDTFIAFWNDRTLEADAFVTFHKNHDGSIASASMQAVSPNTDFSYDFHHLKLQKKEC
jgi:CubicO group peptidase (beta-lactamase class C family)